MNPSPWLLIAETTWSAALLNGRTLGIVLWIGLAVLSVALMVLMRTRWGQAKPLSKCVVLSIFAHFLLFMYAYGTRLFLEQPHPGGDDVIQLAFVDTSQSQNGQVRQSDREPKPWEQFSSESMIEPDFADVKRAEVAATADLQPTADPRDWVSTEGDLPAEDVPERDVDRPTAEAPKQVAFTPTQSQVAAASMEQPTAPTRSEDPQPPMPDRFEPERVHARPVTQRVVDQTVSDQLPTELMNVGSRMQQLADIAARSETADALAATTDQLTHSANQDLSEVNSTGASSSNAPDTSDHRRLSALPLAAGGAVAAMRAVAAAAPPRLGDGQSMPEPYRLRSAENRNALAIQLGGSARTQAAVENALAWLAAQQERDGRWDADRWGAGVETHVSGHDRDGAGTNADTGITGLAILAFLASGQTHLEGEYRRNVQLGLEYLLRSQGADGNLAGPSRLFASMYCHGMASLALSEAFAMTGDVRIRPFVQRAVDYSVAAQHPTSGGWRYQPGDQGDLSQFGWQVMALKSAESAGISIPVRTQEGMQHFLQRCTRGQYGGLGCYRPGTQVSHSMTAEALACRFFLNLVPSQAAVTEAADHLMSELPASGTPNLYYWYYGTIAMFQVQGDQWQRWNEAMQRELLRIQRTDSHLAGSWDADTLWGSYGGRVYSTAMATLCLEVYYRYLPVLGTDR